MRNISSRSNVSVAENCVSTCIHEQIRHWLPVPLLYASSMTDMHPNEFRAHGAELIEWVAQYLDDPRRFPVFPQVKPGDLLARLPAAGPAEGEKMRAILDDFYREILPAITHWNHPRFHAYFALSSTGPAILAELLNAVLNANAMMWRSCPAATELEQTTLRWILDWLRLPTDWFGMILDSASSAVLHA